MGSVYETNGLGSAAKSYHDHELGITVDWTDDRLEEITRLRLLSDPGCSWWDVSYCHGRLKDGTLCRVQLPFSQLQKGSINAQIIKYAKADHVYAKGLGIFENISTLC